MFSSDIVIEGTNGPIDYDLSRVYTGKLEGELKDLCLLSRNFAPSLIFNEGNS